MNKLRFMTTKQANLILNFEIETPFWEFFLFSFFEMGFWRAAHGSGFAWAAQISIIPHPSHFVKRFCENFYLKYFS